MHTSYLETAVDYNFHHNARCVTTPITLRVQLGLVKIKDLQLIETANVEKLREHEKLVGLRWRVSKNLVL